MTTIINRNAVGATILSATALVMPIVGTYAPLGMAPLLILMGLVALVMAWPQRPWRELRRGVGLVALLVGAAGLILAPWAIEPDQSARVAVSFVALAFLGLTLRQAVGMLPEQQVWRLHLCLLAGCVIALGVLSADILSCGALLAKPIWHEDTLCRGHGFLYKRGLTVLTLLMFPLFTGIERFRPTAWWRLLGLGLLVIALLAARSLGADTLLAAIVLTTITFLLVLWWGAGMVSLLGRACMLLVLVTPLLSILVPPPGSWPQGEARLPSSLHHRLTIWQFAGQRWLEKPVLGWGLDASREMPGAEEHYQVSPQQAQALGWPRGYDEQLLPLHTHNMPLQWWLELGIAGGVLLAILVWRIMRAIRTIGPGRIILAMVAATAGAVAIVALLSFGAWQSWWLSTIWIIAALTVTSTRAKDDSVV